MKSFKSYISEEVLPTANVENGNFDIENEAVRSQVNGTLAAVTAQPAVTPYVLLRKVSKALSYFHIILPKRTFLEGTKGVEVYEVMQFGDRMGMTDAGEFVREVPEKYYLFFQYGIAHPFNVTYTKPNIDGMYRGMAKIVDKAELDRLLSAAESMMAESCDDKATMSQRKAGREEIQTNGNHGTPSTDKAMDTSGEKSANVDKVWPAVVKEASTKSQRDAMKRVLSQHPDRDLYSRITKQGNDGRREKKSFASAKKEIKRLKEEEQIDEVSKRTAISAYREKMAQDRDTEKLGNLIQNKWGRETAKHAYRAGAQDTVGLVRRGESHGVDRLASAKSSSEMRKSKDGKIHKQDVASKKSEIKFRKSMSKFDKPRGHLPEETLDEGGMPPSVIKHKQQLAGMSDKDFAEKHGHKTEKQLRDMAARHGYGFDKATKTGSDHYVKRVASSKQIDELYGKGSLEKIRSHHQGEANKLSQGGRKQEKRMGALGRLHRDSEDREDAIKHHMGKAKKARGLMSKLAMREDTLDEKHLTPAETRKKEEIVMSMKKGLPGFKERYGKRAKEVMYATATKRAKQVAEDTDLDEAMAPVKKSYAMRKMKKKVSTQVKQGLGVGKEKTSTVLVTNKGDEEALRGGGVHRIPRDKYDPTKHNLASE